MDGQISSLSKLTVTVQALISTNDLTQDHLCAKQVTRIIILLIGFETSLEITTGFTVKATLLNLEMAEI